MADVDPLRAGDPGHLGRYRLLGRLGEGGQGAVYLGVPDPGPSPGPDPGAFPGPDLGAFPGPDLEPGLVSGSGPVPGGGSRTGGHVAVKLLFQGPDASAPGRFLRESEILRQVSPFCTAQVIETGTTSDGRPYIVSEYVAGPTLQHAVDHDGPLRGGRLRRLAVGTMTALAAIHRAGVVHRDFKPGNVLLGGDGPRVIDFGIARVMDTAVTSSHAVGTPPYMAPEQFESGLVGPEADLFAWGATMVFAASGRPPFGYDSIPAILHRILTREPDLGGLDDDLRVLAADCLCKDPALRPTTKQVLLRLLGASGRPGGDLLRQGTAIAAGPTAPGIAARTTAPGTGMAPRPGTPFVRAVAPARRRGVVVAGAAAVLLAGGTIYVVASSGGGTAEGRRAASSAHPAPVREVTAAPAAATGDVRLPRSGAVLHEAPSDPVRLTSFLRIDTKAGEARTYARAPGAGGFRQVAQSQEALNSPDGAWTALVPYVKPETPGTYDAVRLVRRATGEEFTVPTVRTPLATYTPFWSPDGRRILLTTYRSTAGRLTATGFVVVDAATAKATVVPAGTKDAVSDAPFVWAPGGNGVARRLPGGSAVGLRLSDLRGRPVRTFEGVGESGFKESPFSPAGKRFATLCPGPRSAVCVWDTATGRRLASFTAPASKTVIGWFNDAHLIVADETKDPRRVVVVNLRGQVVRALADIPAAEYGPARFLPRYTRS